MASIVTIPIGLDYNLQINFNPGSQRAPPSGYMNNIDIETRLRNQHFALQHGAEQGIYVPSSSSDLYRTRVPLGSQQDPQPHPDLFQIPEFDQSPNQNIADSGIGKEFLYNHTRTQLRNGL